MRAIALVNSMIRGLENRADQEQKSSTKEDESR